LTFPKGSLDFSSYLVHDYTMDHKETAHQDHPEKTYDYDAEEYHPRKRAHHEESHTHQDVKTYLSWTAQSRPFRKKGQEF
jgi:hypothetical protein